jgi:hypothetical protein
LWLKVVAQVEPQIVIDAAFKFAAQCEAQHIDPKFIPYPETWLNAGRWEDEIPPDPAELAERKAREELDRTRRFLDGDEDAR